MNQIELHNKIDALLLKSPDEIKQEELFALISKNEDARQYFFAKADERWLSWLWENGFLEAIKQKAEDPTRYGYRTPEINYLVKVSVKEPARVVDIMLEVPISAENFNPEVADRFLRICSALPAKELKRMVKKICDDEWPKLMKAFSHWGIEYRKMLKTLVEINDFDSVLILAKAILAVRTKKEMEQTSTGLPSDNSFYFNNLSYTKVFEYLLKVDKKNIGKALALVSDTMKQVVLLGEEKPGAEVFKVYDRFFLFDVDFFTLEVDRKNRSLHRNDVKNLAAVIKQYAVQTIGKQCDNPDIITELYSKYFKSLPDSRSMWRLRLFVMSLCPGASKVELRTAFFRLLEVERYHELISGTEYYKALRAGFSVLSEDDKREYVNQVIEYFKKKDQEKENEKENWHMRYGSRIFSMIAGQIIKEEKQKIKDAGFTIDPDYEPEPSISEAHMGAIIPKGPITQEEFGNLKISEIAKKLRSEWTPKELSKQDKGEDFLKPLNAEGVSELLRVDMSKRLQEYIVNSALFFERDVLDQHYTYSFLRGIEEVLRKDQIDARTIDWDGLITLCTTIKESGTKKPFDQGMRERDSFDSWLSGWTGVHSAITNVMRKLLREQEDKVIIDFINYRKPLFEIIEYLFRYPDPTPESENDIVSDPYSTAINTVRGQAFETFVLFVYQDGKKFSKEGSPRISPDVKELYETILENEKTRALMFMFGHYLPSFYFRDKKWMQGLLPKIFSAEPEKKHLYTAAWEGYLSTSLYKEIFFNPDIQKLYERGLNLIDAEHPKQKYFRDPNESIAVHIALAFIHSSKFGFEHNLFKKFWGIPNPKRHKEFISFIGRYSISRESAGEWMKNNKVDIKKLKKFWDWALENYEPDVLIEFGFWIDTEYCVLDTKWLARHVRQTLEKTKGYIEWEYGLTKSLATFAKEAPEDTLLILRAYLLEEVAKHEPMRIWLTMENEILDAFKELYKNKATKQGVRTLINDLLPYRNGLFWGLKSVLENIN